VSGAPLTNGTYKLIKADGGTVAGTVASSQVVIGGSGGVVAGSAGYLTIVGGELILNVITRPVLSTSLSGSDLTVSWTDSQYQLEAQTNGITGAWSSYPGSSPVLVPIDPANGSVFLRLKMVNP